MHAYKFGAISSNITKLFHMTCRGQGW